MSAGPPAGKVSLVEESRRRAWLDQNRNLSSALTALASAAMARSGGNFAPALPICATMLFEFGLDEGRTVKLRAANRQKEEALWCVFLMFVVMALIIVRTGVVCRSLSTVLHPEEEPQDAPQPSDGPPSAIDGPPSPPSPDDLYRAVVAVLYLAEAAGRLLVVKTREDWELMNQPPCGPALERRRAVVDLCDRPRQRLDTS